MLVPVVVDAAAKEWSLIELQGDVLLADGAETPDLRGVDVGTLRYSHAGEITLRIGNHVLAGKVTKLPKPLAILQKENGKDVAMIDYETKKQTNEFAIVMTIKQQQEAEVRRYVHAGCILVAELHRPRVKNAFNDAMYEQLTAMLAEYEADSSLHAFVLTGYGDYFSSGADVKAAAAILSDGSVPLPSQSWAHRFMQKMLACKKLLVAAVNGPAIGIGVTLLMHCDLVYAAESATFWTPFLRIGIVPEFASSYTFPHLLGPTVANNLLIRSKVFNAKEALDAKLVGDLFPVNGFLDTVLSELEPIVTNRFNKKSLPVFKSLLRLERAPKIREALVYEYEVQDRRAKNGEYLAAVTELNKQFNTKKSSKL